MHEGAHKIWLLDDRPDAGRIALTVTLNVDRTANLVDAAITSGVMLSHLRSLIINEVRQDRVNSIFFAVVHVIREHLDDLGDFELSRAAELEVDRVGEPGVAIEALRHDPALELLEARSLSL